MKRRGLPEDPVARAGAVAADYDILQGLIAVGTGIGLIIMGIGTPPAFGAIWIALSVVFGQSYYYKKYGRVRQSAGQLWAGLGVALLMVVVGGSGIIVDVYTGLPVLVGALTAAVALLVFGRLTYRHVGVTVVHVVAVVVLALCSLLPLTGLVSGSAFWRLDLILIGIVLIVIGAVDHRRLTDAMTPATDE